MMLKKILVFYGYIQIWWEIWQYLWPDLGNWSRLPIYSTSGWNSSFGDCQRMSEPGVVKGILTTLHNQKHSKTKIRNWTKKRPLRVKPIMGKKIAHTVFQVHISPIRSCRWDEFSHSNSPSRCSWRQGPRISPGPVTRSVGRRAWPFARCAWEKIWRDLLGRLDGEMNLSMGNLWKFHGDLWTSYEILWDKNRWFTHQMREGKQERCGGKKHHQT